ncbi:VCBS repeat-containing protein [Maribacter sp. ACAM166]|uniref:VCBS repeat-containing protein n=1 Tax=Maribacter sp. ACAM166 TaxID=2508996 RepID=UPI001485067E|nr:VCBS repeat-containing protein [Maribacter sp. ACAM166]
MFTELSVNETHIDFKNTVIESDSFNINTYLYAHNGGGVALADFDNDGLPDIYFTSNQESNRLFFNKGDLQFDDRTEEAGVSGPSGNGIWCTGVTVVDINQDGWLDIYINYLWDGNMFTGKNQLFLNNGNGTFVESASDFGLDLKGYSQQSTFFDYDYDGDLDMYQLNHSIHDLDVYVNVKKRAVRDSLAGDRLFENQEGMFVDVSDKAGIFGGATGYGLSVAIGDLDNNGCPDIYVSNDFHDNDYLYYNQCNGTFKEAVKESTSRTSTFSMGSDIADLNNDGLLDIMTLDMKPGMEVIRKKSVGADSYDIYQFKKSFGYYDQFPHNMLHLNRGNLFKNHSQFSEISQMAGIDATDWSWSVLLADYDNDGAKDIFITNGILRRPNDLNYINYIYNTASTEQKSSLELAQMMPDGKVTNYAYKNEGNLTFENVSKEWGLDLFGCSMGSAYGDLDNDGDLDLVVNNLNQVCSIYKNNAERIMGNNFLKIKLTGNTKNRNGIGTKVILEVSGRTMVQEMNPVRGWLSSSNDDLLFGLGKEKIIDKVKIIWFDGNAQELKEVPVNQILAIDYKNSTSLKGRKGSSFKLFERIQDSVIDFVHVEDYFDDFANEYLIPHKLSTEGPKIVIGYINNDSLEDFFVTGAKGQAGALFKQVRGEKSNYFEKVVIQNIEDDSDKEDVDAIFLDVDADGDQDLYVVSGGAYTKDSLRYLDRLYLNEGSGAFKKYLGELPKSNGSVVEKGDFNKDGLVDLFVGTRSEFGSYGVSPDSYILWNNGNSVDSAHIFKIEVLEKLGMVSDANWNSKEDDLIVVGEWMPITLIGFKEDTAFIKKKLFNSVGLWNTVHREDLNGDGRIDILAGNLGINSSWNASKDKPLSLIVKDWDQNGSIDPIVAYYNDDKEWIYNSLDELKKQIPLIRKRYMDYETFAKDGLDKVFSKKDLKSAQIKKAQTLMSTVYLNKDGVYEPKPLPNEVQMAPIYTFLTEDINSDGIIDILAAGNFTGFTPSIGKQDVSYGNLLLGNKQGSWKYIEPLKSGFSLQGMSRDFKRINLGNMKLIIIGNNDGPIEMFYMNSVSN